MRATREQIAIAQLIDLAAKQAAVISALYVEVLSHAPSGPPLLDGKGKPYYPPTLVPAKRLSEILAHAPKFIDLPATVQAEGRKIRREKFNIE